jgi:hypothetical protein
MSKFTTIFIWGTIWPYELLTLKGDIKDKVKFIFKNIATV